jgi:hypothetical protein
MFKIELLSLFQETFTFDLIVFSADTTFFREEETIEKGLLNFVTMVTNWKVKLEALMIGQEDFLPFDYEDQYIGFFLVKKLSTDGLSIQFALTTFHNGETLNPSQVYAQRIINEPYQPFGESYRVEQSLFVKAIDQSLMLLLNKLYLERDTMH